MSPRTIAALAAIATLAAGAVAQEEPSDDMRERAAQLTATLGVPAGGPKATARTQPLTFGEPGERQAGEYVLRARKQRAPRGGPAYAEIDVVDRSGRAVASGVVETADSPAAALSELILRLVRNQLPTEALLTRYALAPDAAGDLCIAEKRPASPDAVASTGAVHFVRGPTAVSVYALAPAADPLRPARAIDAALLPPAP